MAVVLFLFGIFAILGSVFLGGEGFIFSFPAGISVAFPLTDILVNAPASLVAAVGLWTLKKYGYPASQFVAGFYIYASVYIFIELAENAPPIQSRSCCRRCWPSLRQCVWWYSAGGIRTTFRIDTAD
jgi:hypothetical protein